MLVYENWQVIAVSQTGDLIVAILGNPEIIAALVAVRFRYVDRDLAGLPTSAMPKCGFDVDQPRGITANIAKLPTLGGRN